MTDTKNLAECGKCGAIHVETRDCPVCKMRLDLGRSALDPDPSYGPIKTNNAVRKSGNNTTQGET